MLVVPLLFALTSPSQAAPTTGPRDAIAPPPAALAYDGFYTKCVYFQGLPILASDKVEDRALRTIVATFGRMLAKVPKGTMAALVEAGCHYSIIAEEEGQTDLPEYADLRNDPKMDWNKRARGLGGQYTSGGEENILEYPTDRYYGESIYIHEFAHTLDQYGFSKVVPNFRRDLREAYDKALAEGLWKQTYAATNPAEYWAEGVQSYFDCNRSATPPNGIHNEIYNRKGLRTYDPRLFALLDRCFGGNRWRYEGKYRTTNGPVSRKEAAVR
jgi:alpha-glucosidase